MLFMPKIEYSDAEAAEKHVLRRPLSLSHSQMRAERHKSAVRVQIFFQLSRAYYGKLATKGALAGK